MTTTLHLLNSAAMRAGDTIVESSAVGDGETVYFCDYTLNPGETAFIEYMIHGVTPTTAGSVHGEQVLCVAQLANSAATPAIIDQESNVVGTSAVISSCTVVAYINTSTNVLSLSIANAIGGGVSTTWKVSARIMNLVNVIP